MLCSNIFVINAVLIVVLKSTVHALVLYNNVFNVSIIFSSIF